MSSTSFVGAMSKEERHAFLDEVRDAVSPFGEPLELAYFTDAYIWDALAGDPSDEGSRPEG